MKIAALFFTCFLFVSCSQQFTATSKLYSAPPKANETVAYVSLGEAFMLTRADFFSSKLQIPNDSIYVKLERISDSVIFNQISKKWSDAIIIPSAVKEKFSKETLKLSKTIFIKTAFPEQGVEVKAVPTTNAPLQSDSAKLSADSSAATKNQITPDYLFIIHEYTIGGDLDPVNFYDYAKANVEQNAKRKFKNLSIILTYTLWDNKKQIPLKSGIAESQTELLNDSLSMEIFANATKQVVEECLEKF